MLRLKRLGPGHYQTKDGHYSIIRHQGWRGGAQWLIYDETLGPYADTLYQPPPLTLAKARRELQAFIENPPEPNMTISESGKIDWKTD